MDIYIKRSKTSSSREQSKTSSQSCAVTCAAPFHRLYKPTAGADKLKLNYFQSRLIKSQTEKYFGKYKYNVFRKYNCHRESAETSR